MRKALPFLLAICAFLISAHVAFAEEGVGVRVTGVEVICEETRGKGPTDNLNVRWTPAAGAQSYEVFRCALPSKDYERVGETALNWWPDTRSARTPYSYKVRAVFAQGEAGELSEAATLFSAIPQNALPPADMTSANGIILLVNKRAQVVTAYTPDETGAYTVVLRHMICSTGKVYDRTRNGVYTIERRMREWYRYPSGVYIRYPSVYRNGFYFHSVLYTTKRGIIGSTVSRLGTRQSLGCVRLKVFDAKWVYENCLGARVYICDGMKIPTLTKALKPKNVKINK